MAENTNNHLALDTVHCLCQNYPIVSNLIEQLYTGNMYATNEDLAQAVYEGCQFFKVDYFIHQWTENQGYIAKNLRKRWCAIYDMGEDQIKAKGREGLLFWFGGLCTALENMMIHIHHHAPEQYREAILHGRGIQNRPSAYQSAMWPQEGVFAALV